jgi:hypothetical protein
VNATFIRDRVRSEGGSLAEGHTSSFLWGSKGSQSLIDADLARDQSCARGTSSGVMTFPECHLMTLASKIVQRLDC